MPAGAATAGNLRFDKRNYEIINTYLTVKCKECL